MHCKPGPVPEFLVIQGRLKRYLFAKGCLFKGERAQQGFQLFFYRDVGKPLFCTVSEVHITNWPTCMY
jgi:hypothetical protein